MNYDTKVITNIALNIYRNIDLVTIVELYQGTIIDSEMLKLVLLWKSRYLKMEESQTNIHAASSTKEILSRILKPSPKCNLRRISIGFF